MTTAVILGSSFTKPELGGEPLVPVTIPTRFGDVTLHRHPARADAYVLFRHGAPHRRLPHQIPYRAHAAALQAVGCRALLLTSSVGIVDPAVPLFEPLVVSDLFMPDNRLPDGSACTIFTEPATDHGHLVLEEGLFSRALSRQVDDLADRPLPRVVFAYVGGPRTKTAAETRWLATTGAQVHSMSLGPEAVLAGELEIPTAGVVVGHRYSLARNADIPASASDGETLRASLASARVALERLVVAFLQRAWSPGFANRLYRFD